MSPVVFWIVAPLIVAAALGMVLARKTVHSALCLAGLMIGLGILYASMDAPFLFVAQLIVYTGSIMMLFLFTMMLIGIDTTESLKETIKGHRVISLVLVVAVAALLILTVGHAIVGDPVGLDDANQAGNTFGLAQLLFGRYVFAFEATAALVVIAALAAMILANLERVHGRLTQRDHMSARMRRYATEGVDPGARPSGGVFARHNAISYPALLPSGEIAPASVSKTLTERGDMVTGITELRNPVIAAHREIAAAQGEVSGETPDLPELVAPEFAELTDAGDADPGDPAATPDESAEGGAEQ